MKGTLLRIFPLVAMILGFAFVSAAYAGDDNETNFTGVVESLPDTAGFIGDWRVSGRTVHVSAAARIEQEHGPVAAGATVKVEGATRADNSVDAREINIKVADDPGCSSGPSESSTLHNAPGSRSASDKQSLR